MLSLKFHRILFADNCCSQCMRNYLCRLSHCCGIAKHVRILPYDVCSFVTSKHFCTKKHYHSLQEQQRNQQKYQQDIQNKLDDSMKMQFYRRTLPETCISFSSLEGKSIFREALDAGHMDCYFRLASQFRTQDDPAYCGLATLVMVLNTLEIDPGRVWKGPWRWFHEDMLDCCVPLEVVKSKGITFDQFACLATCNGLVVRPAKPMDLADGGTQQVDNGRVSLEQFREAVKQSTRRDDCVMVISFSRQAVKQTGDGHFAPIGGYHPSRDLVLLFDTARFKYPPHWIPLSILYASMQAIDKETGSCRGYFRMHKDPTVRSLIMFKIVSTFTSDNQSPLYKLLDQWDAWLREVDTPAENEDIVQLAANQLVRLIKFYSDSKNGDNVGQGSFEFAVSLQPPFQRYSVEHDKAVQLIKDGIGASYFYQIVDALTDDWLKNASFWSCYASTAFLLAYPYQKHLLFNVLNDDNSSSDGQVYHRTSRAYRLLIARNSELSKLQDTVRSELEQLSRIFSVLVGDCTRTCPDCKC